MARRVSRKLELFSIHAHQFEPYSYKDIFDAFSKIPNELRIANVSGTIIGFPHVIQIDEGYFIQVIEGDPSSQPLIFDTLSGTSKSTELNDGEMLGQVTHCVINAEKRLAAVEYVRSGAKALQLGPAIAGILRDHAEGMKNLLIELAPKIAKDFSEEIARFERIRYASIRVTKPNASWTDHYTELSDLMDQSGGSKADLDVRAGRGESLKKNSGIVKIIEEISNDEHPYLEESTVIGVRENESAETTVRSSAHTIHTRAILNTDEAGVAYDTSVRAKLLEFLTAWIR